MVAAQRCFPGGAAMARRDGGAGDAGCVDADRGTAVRDGCC
jgi:hypothetical protein